MRGIGFIMGVFVTLAWKLHKTQKQLDRMREAEEAMRLMREYNEINGIEDKKRTISLMDAFQ